MDYAETIEGVGPYWRRNRPKACRKMAHERSAV